MMGTSTSTSESGVHERSSFQESIMGRQRSKVIGVCVCEHVCKRFLCSLDQEASCHGSKLSIFPRVSRI